MFILQCSIWAVYPNSKLVRKVTKQKFISLKVPVEKKTEDSFDYPKFSVYMLAQYAREKMFFGLQILCESHCLQKIY